MLLSDRISNLPILIGADSKRHRCPNDAPNDKQPGQVHRSEGIRLGSNWAGSRPDTSNRGKQDILGDKTDQDGSCLWIRYRRPISRIHQSKCE